MQDPNDTEGLGGWADVSWPFYTQYETVRMGKPTTNASVSAGGMRFERTFENGVVMVDCATGAYTIEMMTGDTTTEVPSGSVGTTATPSGSVETTQSSVSQSTPVSSSSSSDENIGIYVGIGVGGAAAVLGLALGAWCAFRRRTRK